MGAQTTQEVIDRIQAIATPILCSLGLELVEITCAGQGARTIVRVFIDKPEGVQLGDCEQVHRSLGHALDVEDPVPHAYTLEVSSPGLDRPFRTRRDYEKALEHQVQLKLRQPVLGQYRLVGRLLAVEEPGIRVILEDRRAERVMQVSWEDILEAKRDVEF